MKDLVIGGRTFRSRLFTGTGKFSSNELMSEAIKASGTEMVTVAMKRIDMSNPQDEMLSHVKFPGIQLLPNTSGVRDAEEAVLAAQLAREAFGTDFIKLEALLIVADGKDLLIVSGTGEVIDPDAPFELTFDESTKQLDGCEIKEIYFGLKIRDEFINPLVQILLGKNGGSNGSTSD